MKAKITLFDTNVGSHMWNMQKPDSDYDVFRAYIVPTDELLSGEIKEGASSQIKVEESGDDYSIHEIGKVVDMVLKGNVNFLWGTLSPIVLFDNGGALEMLRPLVIESLSKRCAKSIYGMSKHNYERYVRDNMGGVDIKGEKLTKKANTIVRTLKFGVNILEGRGAVFEPVHNQTMKDVLEWMDVLLDAEKWSGLPDAPPNEADLREYLLHWRIQYLSITDERHEPKDGA